MVIKPYLCYTLFKFVMMTKRRMTVDTSKLISLWRAEEEIAHIHGWDFSHLDGRWDEDGIDLWDYKSAVLSHLKEDSRVLDIDTGGGEFLLSLGHPNHLLSATEAYPPNVQLCKQVLLPLGVDFRKACGDGPLPFEDDQFDLVINRHGSYNPDEIYRVLKPGGLFITQQVGAENDREFVRLLLPHIEALPFSEQYLSTTVRRFKDAGFEILQALECFPMLRFFDIGALVWFACIIQWEFPGFSVDNCLEQLLQAQEQLKQHGCIEGKTHRYFLIARK